MNSQPLVDFSIIFAKEACLISVPPRLTVLEAVLFREQVVQVIQSESVAQNTIILDFCHTSLIDSSGIGALVICWKAAQAGGTKLLMWSVQPDVKAAIALAELDEIFQIEPTSEALQPGKILQAAKSTPMLHPSVYSRTKRVIDIIGALIGLGITSLLLIPIAIAIKLDNPGPIFFRQTRYGLLGKRFKLWKFRSMVINAETVKDQVPNLNQGAFFKNPNDPRITRVGRFLRKTSLDEFPQFWNVLKGDMSIVGTRPPIPEEVEQYDVQNWQRLNVKPGITGEWQVGGRSKISNFEDVIRLDLKYQERWSITYDLILIAKTIWMLLQRRSDAF
jgi:anti-anti-sigma factor